MDSALQTDLAHLDRCHGGALLLTSTGQIIASNTTAKGILHSHPAMFEQSGHLTLRRTHEATLFATALAETAATRAPNLIALRARQGGPIIAISLSPAETHHHVIAVIADLYARLSMNTEDLRTLFGFTSAEARIAKGLANGATPTTLATDLGLSITTIRTHLRALLPKAGATTQTRLIAVLLRAEHIKTGPARLP